MKIEQIYTSCLAQGAYYIESNGEVAIIDPLRETQQYVDKATANNAKIKFIFETHIHADFVSGHVDLAKKTGATIVFGPNTKTTFNCYNASDNEAFKIGDITIKVLHTPGHTLESVTYLLMDETGKNHAVFTGDTLFLGDVGRPDLAVKSDLTEKDLAEMLYKSLRTKIMTLDDSVIVYPAHGAGSACGKNLSKETVGTIGDQKNTNYALRSDMTKDEFVNEVLDGISAPPQYFAKNAKMNQNGYSDLDQVLSNGDIPLSVEAFEQLAKSEEALILDVRTQQDFVKNHISGAVFIGLNGRFAPWVGALISDINQPILLVVPEGKSEEAVTRLARVGYDNTLGYLEGGIQAWTASGKSTDQITSISAEEFSVKTKEDKLHVLDVRKDGEYNSMHLKMADLQHFALDYINHQMDQINAHKTYYIHCAGGYRSVIAASILKARGFHKIVDIAGGFAALKKTNVSISEFVCPSTL
ncbi:MBL fold metallo-hydrolase [Flavobacteriaceae bacterium]|nr:MBL fold metallo-hydrolase [Flavobacteriaceae bacterium]